jgi:hypothetical protein
MTGTATATPTRTSTGAAGPDAGGDGQGEVEQSMPAMNPQAGPHFIFAVRLNGSSRSLKLRVYTKAMTAIFEGELHGNWKEGWNQIGLHMPGISNGAYYVHIRAEAQARYGRKPAVLMVIR